MFKGKIVKLITISLVLCTLCSFFSAVDKVSAAVSDDALIKFEAYGLYDCMARRFKRNFKSEDIQDNTYWGEGTKELIQGTDDDYVSLPAEHNLSGDNDDKISCSKLASNLIGVKSDNDKNPYESFAALLDKFGYEKQDTAGKSKCIKYKFRWIGAGEERFHDAGYIEYCESDVNNDGSINSGSEPTTITYGNSTGEENGDFFVYVGAIDKSDPSKITYCLNPQKYNIYGEECDEYDDEDKTSVSRSLSWSRLTEDLGDQIKNQYIYLSGTGYGKDAGSGIIASDITNGIWVEYNGSEPGTSDSSTANSAFSYEMKSPLRSFEKAYKNFFGKDYSPYTFNKSQQASLYQNYILSYWEAKTQACADTKESSETAGNELLMGDDDNDQYYHQTKLYKSDGTAQYCYVETDKYNKKVYGIKNELPADSKIGFAAVAKWLLDNGPDKIDSSELSVSLSDSSTANDNNTKPEYTCMNSGGAGSLGWIACPILDWVSDSVQNIYSSAVAPLLQVDSKFFSNDEDVGTFHAWGIFQSMANIVFIILFLFVIFSQLTGVGIDNYGIKKIMPKLVVAAVLINLSYLICLICVDISNIAGNGVQSLFNGLDPGGSVATFIDEYNGVTSTHTEEVVTSSGAGATALTAVALVAILAGGFIAIWHNPALLLSLLVSALGVLIAILFLFVLLAGREAAIIVLTVISPLAFVCYILPNTKKFFDKWLKFWEGLLLVYPICGLLVGGGDFVSRLLLSIGFADSNFFMGFVTMIVGIIPIFFIPTVLKGAFAAMGNIGSAFANLGRTARGAATDKIRKSEGYKAVQQQGLDRSVRSKAGYSRRNDRLNAKGRLKSRFAKTGFARALGYGGLQSARVKAASGIVDEEVESRASVEQALAVSGIAKKGGDVKGYYGDMLEKAGKSGSANNVNAVVAAMVNSGQIKEKDIADLMRKHINDGNIKIRNDGTMANVFREMATKYGSGFLSTDAELKDFMQKGGLDKSGNKISSLGNYGDYAKAGHMDATDIKKEDVTKLSGDSLSGLIKSGVLDQGMAQQMLAMNPNISNDKRIMLGAAANNLDISSMTAEQFKETAKSVAQKPDDASTLIQGMSSEMAKALTSATPQSVNVVQNFRGGGRQIEPVDVNLRSNYREPSGYDDDTSTWD